MTAQQTVFVVEDDFADVRRNGTAASYGRLQR